MFDWFKAAQHQLVSAFCIVVSIVSLAGCAYFWATRDMTVISDDSIREEIVPVARLTTYDYNFTQILFLSDAGNPLNIDNPITSKRYLATIDGYVPVQIDADRITCKATLDHDGRLVKVRVSMPHSYIGEPNFDHSTAKKYVEDNGVLGINSVTTDDLNTLLKQAEIDQKKKAEESNLVQASDERVEDLIEAQVKSIHGETVKVEFEYIQ